MRDRRDGRFDRRKDTDVGQKSIRDPERETKMDLKDFKKICIKRRDLCKCIEHPRF